MSNIELSRGERLDQRVVSLLPTLSRSFAVKLITEGKVTVNGVVATKGGQKLRATDEVVVDFEPTDFAIPEIELPVLYEDDDCVVIVKPVGLLTHSKGAYNPEPSVATWLHNRLRTNSQNTPLLKDGPFTEEKNVNLQNNRAGIVHRLDRATSGVMICAKTPAALKYLQRQFAQRKTKKTYTAVIAGDIKPAEAIIDMPVERNPRAPATFRVGAQGKSAVTHYKTAASNGRYSLLELRPETGRTHQLRVHLAHQGHPILGDTLYGGEPAERMYLHAKQLEITIPKDHERKVFVAPVPAVFQEKVQ